MALSAPEQDELLENEGRRDFFALATIGMGVVGGVVVAIVHGCGRRRNFRFSCRSPR